MPVGKSALLELLNSRKCWDCGYDKEGKAKPCPPYKEPVKLNERDVEHAAIMAAKVDDSDPFAYQRMRHYVRRGYVLASEVLKSARSRLSLRTQEPNSGMKGLEPLKRNVDEDRAWNQHRAQEYSDAAE